ncbi:hypothetical protein [Nostoc sp. 106C]|nr:hypothetical protein [Nostoc sp. 106C]
MSLSEILSRLHTILQVKDIPKSYRTSEICCLIQKKAIAIFF